ncbi:ScpA family protein [Litoribacillus peritrichatus]|uniref:Segregation and condensation protein A n=1 Tax=Litoribacillus peritrichatus TaxID=718191 RepID=A0ABP7M8U9_9GAMM
MSDTVDSVLESASESDTSAHPEQQQLPLAKVGGEPVTEIPQDLYIPPEALEVFLDAFEGPLDLLLYLIRKQNIDILDINISQITAQYMEYVELMKATRFELAAEYLVMAAMLAEIKSRSLLPRNNENDIEEEDPRAELIRRLQEYERFKVAAENLDEIPRLERDVMVAPDRNDDFDRVIKHPDVDLREVLVAMSEILKRAEMFEHHHISREVLSTRERMSQVLNKVKFGQLVSFMDLFSAEEGKMGVVVTFMAVMELIKESLLELSQSEVFGEIYVRARMDATEDSENNDDQESAPDALIDSTPEMRKEGEDGQ